MVRGWDLLQLSRAAFSSKILNQQSKTQLFKK